MKPIPALSFALLLALPAAAQIPNTLKHSLFSPSTVPEGGEQQGYSVAVDGNLAVVGSPLAKVGGSNSGVAKVYDVTSGQLLHVLSNPTPASQDFFGYSVAISGSRVVVGAYQDDTDAFNAGRAYVYDLASPTPTVPVVALLNPSPAVGNNFGVSVGISGSRVVVGVQGKFSGANQAGVAHVYDLTRASPEMPEFTLNNPAGGSADNFGNAVAISGTRIVVGVYGSDVGGTDSGRAYVYDVANATPTTPVATLNNPHPASGDWFGRSVAISGSRVVVGAVFDDTVASNAGSVYIYDIAGASPTVPTHELNEPVPVISDQFGTAVAVFGTLVIVGCSAADFGATNAGDCYVYDLAGATPTVPTATLHNPTPSASDQFGLSVAIGGTKAIIGTPFDDSTATDAGSAYVYDLSGAPPASPAATLNNPSPRTNDQFGGSVAVSGAKIAVGAALDDTGGTDAGSVYVFDLSSASPTVPAFIINGPGAFFGFSVAISGQILVAGAYAEATGADGAGSAYVYDLGSATPTVPIRTLHNPSPFANDWFGYSVAVSGTRIVVGAFLDNAGAGDAGIAYVYDLTSPTPTVPVYTLNNPSPTGFDYFGYSVAISGSRVVVGAYQEDDAGAISAGSAYVYDLAGVTPTVPAVTLPNPHPVADAYFGLHVAISGTRVAAHGGGKTYVFELNGPTPAVPIATLNQSGSSLAIAGTRVVVGNYFENSGADQSGRAYIYDLAGQTPLSPVATLNNPNPAATDRFGNAVAADGTTVVVGAYLDDTTATDKGAAYIYTPHPLDQDSDGLRDSWELTYWPTTTGHSPLDDSDHDGYCELLELAFGLNPTLPDAGGLSTTVNESGYLTMTITKQAGVTYEVQSAGSLLPALPDSFSATTTTVITNNATTLKVRDNFPIGTAPGRFMRVKVTAAP